MAARSAIEDFEVLDKIGHGTYGVVYKVLRRQDGLMYAMKEVDLEGLSEKEQQECIQETGILSSLNSPHIIKYFDSFLHNGKLCIVTELAGSGNLHDYIQRQRRKLPEDVVWKLFIQVLLGLNHMHKRRMLHRDIKTLNVFLDEGLNAKLGDMGVAKVLNSTSSFARSLVGTPYYLSPELCEDRPYNYQSDVWALGVVLYECCTQKHPFDADNQGALILKILRGKYPPVTGYSPDLIAIIQLCLTQLASVGRKAVELGLHPMPSGAVAQCSAPAAQAAVPEAGKRHMAKGAAAAPAKPYVSPKAGGAAAPPRPMRDPGFVPSQRVRDRGSAGQPRQLPTRASRGPAQGVIRVLGNMDRPAASPLRQLQGAGVTFEPIVRTDTLRRQPGAAASADSLDTDTGVDTVNDGASTGPDIEHPGASTATAPFVLQQAVGELNSTSAVELQRQHSSRVQAQPGVDFLPTLPGLGGLRIHKLVGADKAFVFGSASPSHSGHIHVLVSGTELTAGDAGAEEEDAQDTTWPMVAGWKVVGASAPTCGAGTSATASGEVDAGSHSGSSTRCSSDGEGSKTEQGDADQTRRWRIQLAQAAQKEACVEAVGQDNFLQLYALLRSAQADEADMPDASLRILQSHPNAMQMMCKLLYLEGQLEGIG